MSLPVQLFGLLSGSLLCFIVWNHPQKNVKPNKRAVSTKSARVAILSERAAKTF